MKIKVGYNKIIYLKCVYFYHMEEKSDGVKIINEFLLKYSKHKV